MSYLEINIGLFLLFKFPLQNSQKRSTDLIYFQRTMKLAFVLLFLVFAAFSTEKNSRRCQLFDKNCCKRGKEKENILQDDQGKLLLDIGVIEQLEEELRGHETEIVKLIIAQKCDFSRADELGQTPVFLAAWGGYTQTVKFLAAQRVDLNQPDDVGCTPVYIAAYKGHTKIVTFLAAQGVDLNQPRRNGFPPVFAAAKEGHKRTVEILIEAGANLEEYLLSSAATEDIKHIIAEALERKLKANFWKLCGRVTQKLSICSQKTLI